MNKLRANTLNSPRPMREAPRLDPTLRPPPPRARLALLLNPFYPKDPHASFGKHVLTPTLALTSIAAATPADWEVEYWDENLLQGSPPSDPFPQVVGISVHLTDPPPVIVPVPMLAPKPGFAPAEPAVA